MASRASWKGYLRLSLVSIPLKAYTAERTGSEVRLNQLHRDCHSPIRYRKTCPLHGEVEMSSIVSGYEYSKGQYVVVEPQEIDRLRPESEKAINVDGFVPAGAVDPLHYTGKDYFLAPDGPVGVKPYRLLHRAMADDSLHAVALAVLFGREQVVVVRPYEHLLVMSPVKYAAQIKDTAEFDGDLREGEIPERELALTKQLIAATRIEDFDIAAYKDVYTERLTQLIEAKVAGREVVAAPQAEEPQVIDLMEALKQSVARAAGGKKAAAGAKEARRKMAPSARQRASTSRRKKKSG